MRFTMFFFMDLLFFMLAFASFKLSLAGPGDEEACSKFAYDHQMLDKIVRVEENVRQMNTILESSLESFHAILQYRKEQMQTQFNKLEEIILNNLTTKIDTKLAEISQTEQLLSNKIPILDGYIQDHVDFPGKLAELEKDIKGLVSSEKLREQTVAFSATNPYSSTYSANQVLVLQDTSLNEGSGYNATTGEFTAPVAGLYLFSAHTCQLGSNWVWIAIVVGSKEIANSAHFGNSHECSSVSALSYVRKGEKVYLKITHASSFFTDRVRQSSFIGARLGN